MKLSHSFTALLCFCVIFCGRLAYEVRYLPYSEVQRYYSSPDWNNNYSYDKRNFASGKVLSKGTAGGTGLPVSHEKYEKIATLSQSSSDFENDERMIRSYVEKNDGVIQFESASGLPGNRVLGLGIGVPPQKFDSFIDEIKKIGTLRQIAIVKNDKTSEYQKLAAQKEALEKYRDAITSLRTMDARVEERLKLEERYIDIERQLQEFAVSLGDFNTQNELYTVKLSLNETKSKLERSFMAKVESSLKISFISFGILSLIATGLYFIAGLLRWVSKNGARKKQKDQN